MENTPPHPGGGGISADDFWRKKYEKAKRKRRKMKMNKEEKRKRKEENRKRKEERGKKMGKGEVKG